MVMPQHTPNTQRTRTFTHHTHAHRVLFSDCDIEFTCTPKSIGKYFCAADPKQMGKTDRSRHRGHFVATRGKGLCGLNAINHLFRREIVTVDMMNCAIHNLGKICA